MHQNSISSKEVIRALASMKFLVKRLLNKGKEYDSLLLEILNYDYYDEKVPTPTASELQKKIGMSSSLFKKRLDKLYEDFKSLISMVNTEFVVADYVYEIFIHHNQQYFAFHCKLPVPPRVGENLQISFLKPIFDCQDFYVHTVYHNICNNIQVISILLRAGYANQHEMYVEEEIIAKEKYTWEAGSLRVNKIF